MKERLDQLKILSRPLEPDLDTRQRWTQKVNAHAEDFMESLVNGPAFRSTLQEGKGILASPLTEAPQDPDLISGNFFASPGAVRLEHLLTRWMAEFVGYPKSSAGDLTSGGSVSNLSAVAAAREHRGLKARDYEKTVVYLTSQTHHSVTKALRLAGMGDCITRVISLDSAHRMRPDLLQQAIQADQHDSLLPWLIVASAGSTDTGAIDPLHYSDFKYSTRSAFSWAVRLRLNRVL